MNIINQMQMMVGVTKTGVYSLLGGVVAGVVVGGALSTGIIYTTYGGGVSYALVSPIIEGYMAYEIVYKNLPKAYDLVETHSKNAKLLIDNIPILMSLSMTK